MNTADISPIILQILSERGITTTQDIKTFLNPDISSFSNPFSICGIQAATKLIEDAIYSKKRVFIYADGDMDGMAGAAMLSNIFKAMGLDFDIKLTHRLESYEIESEFVNNIKKMGYNLLITIDTGTSSKKLIDYCEKTKFPLIIIDHHRTCIEKQPLHVVIVNPSLHKTNHDFITLTAAGLVLKLVQAIKELFPFFPQDMFYPCIELGAMGTLNDHGMLTGENHTIVKMGLRQLGNTQIPGIERFKEHFYVPKKDEEIETITHYLNPRLNTPGRFGKPELAFKILTAGIDENIESVFEEIKTFEKEKQKIMRRLSSVVKNENIEELPLFVFENIPVSFSGTFAARISEQFQMPALVAIKHNDIIQGSARGFDSINLYEFFYQMRDIFSSFGGHPNAIGFKMKSSNLPELKKLWKNIKIGEKSSPSVTKPVDIKLNDITIPLLKNLQMLRPFGPGNPQVTFKSYGVECVKITRYQKTCAIAWIKQNNCLFEAHFPAKFTIPSRLLSISYTPVLQKSGDLYIAWLDIKDYSEIF
ncbi:MAG TPA: DHH family phosphoesterase [bacterium]|nr:DHH family phosphoesterase [bacterium]